MNSRRTGGRLRVAAVLPVLLLALTSGSASARGIWDFASASGVRRVGADDLTVPAIRLVFDPVALDSALDGLARDAGSGDRGGSLALPGPDGQAFEFRLRESRTMSELVRSRRPDIRTFAGWLEDDPSITVRIIRWGHEFRAVIDGVDGWTVATDPDSIHNEAQVWRHADEPSSQDFECGVRESGAERRVGGAGASRANPLGDELVTYRLAISAPGEFTEYHGSVAAAEAEIVELVNLANEIFERDLSISMQLVDLNVYADPATDPFTNGTAMNDLALQENHNALIQKLGNNGFDLGHVVSRLNQSGWSGLGRIAVQCDRFGKGYGGTFSSVPNAFPLREGVLHEIGHQLGAWHSFNGTAGACGANRVPQWAYEIASGISIMSYAGICGSENVTIPRVLMYDAGAIEAIDATVAGSGSCGDVTPTGNIPPIADAGPDYTIPTGTAFSLDGNSSSDPDGGLMSFSWEQHDLGAPSPPYGPADGPLFRNFAPTTSSTRWLPDYDAYRTGTTVGYEFLPSVDRTLTFRLIVRDNAAGGGGVAWDTTVLTVEGAPFSILSPDGGEAFPEGEPADLVWQVGGGSVASRVRLSFSADAGQTWTEIVPDTENDGTESVAIPCGVTDEGRLRVDPLDNVFYDISDMDFQVTPDQSAPVVTCPPPTTVMATGPDGIPSDDPALDDFVASATVVDNCDPDPPLTFAAPPLLSLGVNSVTFFSVDATGNSAFCSTEVTVTPITAAESVPGRTALLGVHPNPFNPRTTIRFQLARLQAVLAEIVDLRGRRVATVFEGRLSAGVHEIPWDGSGASSGVYVVRLQTEDGAMHRRVALLK